MFIRCHGDTLFRFIPNDCDTNVRRSRQTTAVERTHRAHDSLLSARASGDRVLEWGIGLLLVPATLVPAAVAIGSVFEVVFAPSWFARFVFMLAAVGGTLTAWWCGATAWRLFSGKERRSGGLLSVPALLVGSILCLTIAAAGVTAGGFEVRVAPGAIRFGSLGIAGLLLARSRRRSPGRSARDGSK